LFLKLRLGRVQQEEVKARAEPLFSRADKGGSWMFRMIGKQRLRYDLLGEGPRTVCFVHALAADSGMWAEQVPAVLARGTQPDVADLSTMPDSPYTE